MFLQKFTKAKYDIQVLKEAIEAVRSNKMSLRAASKHFGIKLTTLADKVKGRTPIVPSPRTLLTTEEEDKLVKWLLQMAEVGFDQTTEDVRIKVKAILELRGGTTKDKDYRPSYEWVYSLLKRYPQLSLR